MQAPAGHLCKQQQSKHRRQKEARPLCRRGRAGREGGGRNLLYLGATPQNVCTLPSEYSVAFGSPLYRATSWPLCGESLVRKVVLSLRCTVVFEYPAKFPWKPGSHRKGVWRGRSLGLTEAEPTGGSCEVTESRNRVPAWAGELRGRLLFVSCRL